MVNYHTGVLQSSFSCDTHNHEKLSLVAGKTRIMYNIRNTRFLNDVFTAVTKVRQNNYI